MPQPVLVRRLPLLVASVVLATVSQQAAAAETGRTVGNLIFNMMGGMIVDNLKADNAFSSPPAENYVPHDRYSASDPLFNEGFSPAEGISCYPKQGLCFDRMGRIDAVWTSSIYAK